MLQAAAVGTQQWPFQALPARLQAGLSLVSAACTNQAGLAANVLSLLRCHLWYCCRPYIQGEELEPARAKAEQMGVKDIFIDDLREEFVRDYVFPMFRANALYEGVYLLGTSIARWGSQAC